MKLAIRFVLFALLASMACSAHSASYRIHELSPAAVGSAGLPCLGMANSISPGNRIVGVVYDGPTSWAVISDENGKLTFTSEGYATAVNSHGEMVGYAGAAAVWDTDGNLVLLPLPSGTSFSLARGVNDLGTIVGECWLRNTDVRNYATLWAPGAAPIILGEGCANAINASGAVVGSTRDTQGDSRAFYWSAGSMTVLSGGRSSEANAINDSGTVAGAVRDGSGTWACKWDSTGALSVLANPEGAVRTIAYGVNNAGAVVGNCDTNTGSFGALWAPDGTVTILSGLAGHTGTAAYGISQSGWIAGCSIDADGMPHPVFWELVPEPSSVLALAVGIAGLLPLLRRRSVI